MKFLSLFVAGMLLVCVVCFYNHFILDIGYRSTAFTSLAASRATMNGLNVSLGVMFNK